MRTLIAALATAALLAGCSSVGLNPTTAARVQAIDYVNDDIGSVLIAFDIPLALEPVPDGSVMVFTLGGRTLRTVLTRADLDDAVQALPPPRADRTYYLFGFSAADRASIKALQAEARASGGAARITVALNPGFCRVDAVDPARTRFSVLLALPGGGGKLEPLIDNATLQSALSAVPGSAVPACAGHSG